MIERFKSNLKGKQNLINFGFILIGLFGCYLLIAWASYSPLDNAWSTASSVTHDTVLNKTGKLGAWLIDLLYAFLGNVAFVVPFVLFSFAIYALIFRIAEQWKWRNLLLQIGSFILLLIGLSGIASVLLPNSAYYLAGGFVGGMLQSLLNGIIGQVGLLLLSTVLMSIGFYFCSGQLLFSLGIQFYQWLFIKKPQSNTILEAANPHLNAQNNETTKSIVANPSENAHVDQLVTHENATEQLTDVSAFTRPTIHGLKSSSTLNTDKTKYNQVNAQPLTDPMMFKIEKKVILPKINMQHPENELTNLSMEQTNSIDNLEIRLPKVHLNTAVTNPEIKTVEHHAQNRPLEMPTQIQPVFDQPITPTISLNVEDQPLDIESNEAQLAEEFAAAEQMRLANMEQRAKAEGLEETFNQIITSPTLTVSINESSEQPTEKDLNPTHHDNGANYPKGYGKTLLHPLLQRNNVVEKPTTPLPTLELLAKNPVQTQQITEQEIFDTSHRLENALANYNVKATVEDVLVGPVVTRYEIKPAAGIKANKVTALANDLARELMFKAIRITEVVPGKPYMGIETPNTHRQTVWLRDVLDSEAFRHTQATLPMALGKDISGQPIVVDMAKMPHLLVAGQTGGGKSVGINTMILSLLFKLTPEQVRFIMIDPKVVELSVYNDIPHLLTPVVTDMKKAANALRWAVGEMERRYLLISHLQVRNIEGYNDKIDQASAMNFPIPDPTWRPADSIGQLPPPLTKLSYIVLIVDEFADLIMSAGKEVEEYIMRIAQKARAVGIHLILATQRPSTDVITGVIKANIPSRIAFTVASQIDSRTILDAGGAEALLGRGDMLYSASGSPEIMRIHGAFMSDEEVQRIADNWRARGKPQYLDSVVASHEDENDSRTNTITELDPLFDEIVAYVIESGVTSISGIQRRFSLGFNRAGRIIDQMEAQAIISEPGKGGKREVLAR
ncbi:cell division protein FtsK [[Haemophilus] ducreyi]|uniref:DNA translocase FtsK n=1 Tax=Haemophilus ducreyi TaxID=730 RepID=A0AAC8UCV0_HAEDC|nr:DNA translocase FtsK [[Haemophilus] ducreyi]AKO31217.1 cell division protein FtsK [[Haemophilus] ducreyi]AKO32662.1 cell division protein FtsK [[Haemophilus] ducreyi]AKO34112.1 cell division protein FtsK [[Haemophilus] ducreyi]AKO35559.1 cell division protein FtsK [[Haemophilus] ducreyi]AKO39914.1 cell division protein FtsK [[Haemophilus] ducreyi]